MQKTTIIDMNFGKIFKNKEGAKKHTQYNWNFMARSP